MFIVSLCNGLKRMIIDQSIFSEFIVQIGVLQAFSLASLSMGMSKILSYRTKSKSEKLTYMLYTHNADEQDSLTVPLYRKILFSPCAGFILALRKKAKRTLGIKT